MNLVLGYKSLFSQLKVEWHYNSRAPVLTLELIWRGVLIVDMKYRRLPIVWPLIRQVVCFHYYKLAL